TTACDKTTPASLMAAATVNLPAIVLSGGPMIDSYYNGKLAGSGMALWEARRLRAANQITDDELIEITCQSSPGPGHCNTMGTALSMNSVAEALGMALPGCAAIPAPDGARARMAYETGKRIVEMVREDLTPKKILTREAFENAIVVNSAIGGSTNCAPHITAIARHIGVEVTVKDFETVGHDVPLLANVQPAGELLRAGRLHENAITANGRTVGENCRDVQILGDKIIRPYSNPVKKEAGFMVLSGNLFTSALIKTSVISPDFRKRFLSDPNAEECFVSRVIVFDGPEDYRRRIEDPSLNIDE